MNKIRMKKTHILIVVYIILIVTELFYFVPYHDIDIFISNQNVPHTVITNCGYMTMDDMRYNYRQFDNKRNIISDRVVNTPQLIINVSITTLLAAAIFFLLQKNEKVKRMPDMEIPVIDVNALAFATEDEIQKAQQDYAKQMVEYIKRNM